MAWKGTAEDRRRWAIKKRQERQAEASQRGSKPLSGYAVAPNDHACDPYEIEYGDVPVSRSQCTVCGRTWTYAPTGSGWFSVTVEPLTTKKPST